VPNAFGVDVDLQDFTPIQDTPLAAVVQGDGEGSSDGESEDSFLQRVADAISDYVEEVCTFSFVQRQPRRAIMQSRRSAPRQRSTQPARAAGKISNVENFSASSRISAFPQYLKRTLRYAQTNVIDVANFGTSQQVFRANSLFDPDFTGAGHQPNGFDQIIAAFNHFTVTRARIRVRVLQVNTGGGVVEPGAIVLAYSDTGAFMASQADYPACIEKRNT